MGSFTIQDLSFTYPERDKPALSHVSMTIADGDFVCFGVKGLLDTKPS